MKKILLTLLYPMWYILAKTCFGYALMMVIVPLIPAAILCFVFPDLLKSNTEQHQSIGIGFAVLGIGLSGYTSAPFFIASDYLESKYNEYKYKAT